MSSSPAANADRGRPPLKASTPLPSLAAVGPAKAELLARMGLRFLRDLLLNFPRDWEDLTDLKRVEDLQANVPCAVQGVVEEIDLRSLSGGRSLLGVLVRQGDQSLRAVWFNQPFLAEKFFRGQPLVLEGKPKYRGGAWEMAHPQIRPLDSPDQAVKGRVLPIYRLTEGLTQPVMRRLMERVIPEASHLLVEVFPESFRQEHELLPIDEALRQLHLPADRERLTAARHRFVFQELLVMQLALALQRRQQATQAAAAMPATAKIDARIRRLFPFELTAGQQAAIAAVSADLSRTQPMNRLLQGDVGCGKTVVALYAMLVAVANGYQAALMAPTEVLARQHWQTLSGYLQQSQVRRALFVGGLGTRERYDLRSRLAEGELDLVVGTQALLSEDVTFSKLGLVVIDEQHKFGVRQRAGLKGAATAPHYLIMSATPIPRTLGLTVYGDLDITSIPDKPPGRGQVETYCVPADYEERWWRFCREKIAQGQQAYVIAPRVNAAGAKLPAAEDADLGSDEPDGSAEASPASVEELADRLRSGPLQGLRVGVLHGQLAPEAKAATLQAFRDGNTQVLVSTTVVEVGVDVPAATMMAIFDGHRFGLAALHQLRGRIGRNRLPGFCCVFSNTTDPWARQRLEAFAATTDGFELAELDLQLRGPGSLLGTRQAGLPPLYVADFTRDRAVVEQARAVAQSLLSQESGWPDTSFAPLRELVVRMYGRVLELGDVG